MTIYFRGQKKAVSFSRFECARSFPYSCITHHLKNVQLVFWIELAILYRVQISIFLIVSFFFLFLKKPITVQQSECFFFTWYLKIKFDLKSPNMVLHVIDDLNRCFFRSTMHICHLNSCIIIWFPFTDSIMNKLRQINDKKTIKQRTKKLTKRQKNGDEKKMRSTFSTEKSRRKSINVNFCNPVDP